MPFKYLIDISTTFGSHLQLVFRLEGWGRGGGGSTIVLNLYADISVYMGRGGRWWVQQLFIIWRLILVCLVVL